jgi:hypothetical protein
MSLDLSKIQAAAAQAVKEGADQTVAKTGGGDYTPPPEGTVALRFFGYIELGKQPGTYQGKPTVKEEVALLFEAAGKKYLTGENNDKPTIFAVVLPFSLNEKSHYFKLFTRMNHAGKAQHMAQLLGEGFKATVVHDKWTSKKDGKERITAELRDASGYTIGPARVDIMNADGEPETVPMPVPALQAPLKVLFWNNPDMEQWASLFIDGEYPERKDKDGKVTAPAKSKNVWQNKVKQAKNFKESPLYLLLANNGQPLDIPEPGEDPDDHDSTADIPEGDTPVAAAVTPTGAAADDALAGIGG